jgi:hypothetical protein
MMIKKIKRGLRRISKPSGLVPVDWVDAWVVCARISKGMVKSAP